MSRSKRMTRRTLLKAGGVAASMVTLAACRRGTPQAPKVEASPTPLPPATAPTATPEPAPTALPTSQPLTPDAVHFFDYGFQDVTTSAGRMQFPVSFRYDDKEPAAFLPDWQTQWATGTTANGATPHTATLTDPKTGLECRCEVTTFAGLAALEWVVYFKNTGTADTPLIADIQPLDVVFPTASSEDWRVLQARGSQSQLTDFAPIETPLNPNGFLNLAPYNGRSSNGTLPFFNLHTGDKGVIGAIGWTGGWSALFERDESGIRLRAGMQETSLRLHPGEEIRTPRIALLFWENDPQRGHNVWRRFILAHHTPRPNGQLLQPPIADAVWGERREQDQIAKARWLKDNNLPVEYFWIDAGWYGDRLFNPTADTFGTAWAEQVGEWYPLKAAYPNGLKPVGDALKAMGLGFVLWFEPERARTGTQYVVEHPDWFLGPIENNYLLNLGDPAARRGMTDTISALITEGGVTCYRQDFNMDPALFWRGGDAPDRVGMTEIRHIEGLYAFWDELLAQHPGLIIDNCSSGGRRIDLETTSRSVPLWRSDVQVSMDFNPIAMQSQTHGLSLWVPLSTGCCRAPDTYAFRSALGPGIVLDWSTRAVEMRETMPVELCRRLLAEMNATRKYFYGDFYPLTPFTVAPNAWAAWQFDRPDLGEGMLLALRRPTNGDASLAVRLQGLDAAQEYELRSLDDQSVSKLAGRDLLEKDLTIQIADAPGSALFIYKRIG